MSLGVLGPGIQCGHRAGRSRQSSASSRILRVSPLVSAFVLSSKVTSKRIGRKSKQLGDSINDQ